MARTNNKSWRDVELFRARTFEPNFPPWNLADMPAWVERVQAMAPDKDVRIRWITTDCIPTIQAYYEEEYEKAR